MSMNVRWIQVLVTKTLTVPTVTVLTAALVNKDLPEMAQFVKVLLNFQKRLSRLLSIIYRSFCFSNIRQVSHSCSVIPVLFKLTSLTRYKKDHERPYSDLDFYCPIAATQ